MHNLVLPATSLSMDAYAPEFCFCGRKTVETHEFWFCSTDCARLDALRALDDPKCHYRNVVRKAHHKAGIPELYPRRMASADHLRPRPFEHRAVAKSPIPFIPPVTPRLRKKPPFSCKPTQDRIVAGFPSLSEVTGKILGKKAVAREPAVVAGRRDGRGEVLPDAPPHANPVDVPQDHTFQQISLDSIPFPEPSPVQPHLRDHPERNMRKSVTALLGRSQKGKERENPERIFGHPVKMIIPPVRKESLPSYRQINTPPAVPEPRSRTLRRSASFAAPHNQQDLVMQIIEEMREEMAESFDLRAMIGRDSETF